MAMLVSGSVVFFLVLWMGLDEFFEGESLRSSRGSTRKEFSAGIFSLEQTYPP